MLHTINRRDYPELDKLLWDVHSATITPELAFRVYEERWGFVKVQKLSSKEQTLIQILTRKIGHGIFAPLFETLQCA